MRIFLKVSIILFALVNTSCERLLISKNKASNSPHENFEYLWSELDKKYSYFELKKINWDSIKTIYNSRIDEDLNEYELFEILSDLMNELKDDHSNLISPFNVSRFNISLKSNANFRLRTIEENYFTSPEISGSFYNDFIAQNQIGYIRYSSFSNHISASVLDYLLLKYQDTKGIILDLRENGGGSIVNVPKLLERFVKETKTVGYFRTRNGINHSDFSDNSSFIIHKHNGINYTKPVFVLIDRGSYSATTMFALGTKPFENITLVGDTTGGGGGLPNGGQLPNGWTYRFSISQLLDRLNNNYAEDGVPCDINQQFDWNDLSKDEILEKAIEEILK
ncbi:MAG: S41 family peptidase [Crocinitomicaceae bacterium]